MTSPGAPLLELRGITKTFPGVKALSDVNFTARAGEIHALMGENGAGKSTLIKVLTGVYRRDAGDILLSGASINPHSTDDAQRHGISTVYQEVNLIPHLSVAENICLGRHPKPWIAWRTVRERARAALRRLGIDIDVTEAIASYSIAIQQLVAIGRALDISAQVLVLDEPTSSLDEGEVERLFNIMHQLKAEGLAIIFVTHFLDQVYAVSDKITVLRNGKLVGEFEAAALPRLQLISKMMGRELTELDLTPTHTHSPTHAHTHSLAHTPFLQLRQIGRKGSIKPLDLDIAEGEVLGLSGLLGSGRTETARLIFGIDHPDTGELLIDGQHTRIRSPLDAICHRFGFCPEDRKIEGIIPNLSVRENIALALQASQGWTRYVSRAKQLELADKFIKALNIVTPHPEQAVRLLSGGNQQKVILARWLASHPRLLLLDEPTRGIDVGAKLEIEKLIAKLTAEGMAILFISSDLEEMVRNSHRVVVLRDRQKVAELGPGQISEQSIMHAIAAPTHLEGTR
ncbi:MAG TPA: sugar ABC transporter ATP-binding protein [Candidatus Binatia bacterium]|nr:sugar ABC transporter ATP-binding protein [Candidatus Binatia bacterium]